MNEAKSGSTADWAVAHSLGNGAPSQVEAEGIIERSCDTGSARGTMFGGFVGMVMLGGWMWSGKWLLVRLRE